MPTDVIAPPAPDESTADFTAGLCHCGCGGQTNLATKTQSDKGIINGQPRKFINGHQCRLSPVDYVIDEATGCWIWQLASTNGGYGLTRVDGGRVYAHRLFYERAKGPIPERFQVDHLCRVPACVNPDHLEAVTPAENVRRSSKAKLDWTKVAEIRASDSSNGELARRFNVSHRAISQVRSGERWTAR